MKLSKLLLLALLLLSITISCKKEKTEEAKEKIKLYILVEPGLYSTAFPVILQLSGTNIETQNDIRSTYIKEVEFNKGETQTLSLKVMSGEINEISLAVTNVMSLSEHGRIAYKTSRNGDISLTFTP